MRLPRLPDRTWLAAILAAALALRAAELGRADLWTDEIQTLHAARLDWGALVSERLRAGHVPLYFLVEKAWCAAFGESQAALRLPAAFFGTALLVPAWSLLRRLAGARAAWWGTALLAVHPLLVELSREARMYSLLGLVTLVAADRVVATLDGERPGAAFWTAAALGPLVHPTWAFAAVPLAAWAALERRSASPDARRTSRTALVGLAASVAVLLLALFFAHPQTQDLTRRPWHREIGVFVLRIFVGSDLRPFHNVLAVVGVLGAWAAYVGMGLLQAPVRARRLAMWWAAGVPAVSVAVGVAGGLPWGPARYVQLASVGFALLFAAAAAARNGARPAIVLLLAFVCSIGPILSPATHWSAAAASLRDDPTPVVVDGESERIVLAHYLGRDVFVGAPPEGATSWRHASLVAGDGRRAVKIEAVAR